MNVDDRQIDRFDFQDSAEGIGGIGEMEAQPGILQQRLDLTHRAGIVVDSQNIQRIGFFGHL
jgi:hypothetical protein